MAGAFQNLLNIFPENGTNQRNLKSPFASLWLTSKQRQDHIDLPQVANGVKFESNGYRLPDKLPPKLPQQQHACEKPLIIIVYYRERDNSFHVVSHSVNIVL